MRSSEKNRLKSFASRRAHGTRRADNQILGVADLRTVWLSADIYEAQLPLVAKATVQEVSFTSDAWPGKTFTTVSARGG